VDPTVRTWLGTRLASYRVDELIGRGGMGEVYRAFDLRLERPVALKLLAAGLSDDERFRERLLRESRLAAALDHPNVVPVYEAGEDAGRLFIAMRYVEGSDLRALLRSHGRLEPERVVRMAAPLADALDSAHARGLVHRDVKPSNVLVDDPGGREHPYLADFGLTQSAAHSGPADGGLMGTIDYVAPEQVRGEQVDGRADQYALGCLLFECLTGTLPFGRGSDLETLFAHLDEPPPPASAHRAELPADLDAVLAKGMAKEPDARYGSCSELVQAAGAALGVGLARPRRRTGVLALAIAVPALLAVALAVALLAGGGESRGKPPGALVKVDPDSGRVARRTPVSGAPSAVAAGGGTVWLASSEDDKLWRVRPRGGRPTRVSSVGSPHDIAYRGGRMFVAGDGPGQFQGNVVAFDAESGNRESGVELLACSITAGAAEGVWSSGCPNVERLEPGANRLRIAKRLALPFREPITAGTARLCQCDMATGGGAVGVLGDALDPRVWKIDAKAGRVLGTATLPFPVGRGIAYAGGAVWVAGPADDVVSRVDAGTLELTKRVRVGRGPAAIAARGDQVWVGNWLGRTLTEIDARSGGVVRTVELSGRPAELAFGSGGLWVAVDER
jgi:DNA-binding beta-propeller fold protein YncE